uniref:Uncharacterized protein n=1 Tax=Arundo donax TaxID=35708 RepID=A0A0A9E6X2_ARUDO
MWSYSLILSGHLDRWPFYLLNKSKCKLGKLFAMSRFKVNVDKWLYVQGYLHQNSKC